MSQNGFDWLDFMNAYSSDDDLETEVEDDKRLSAYLDTRLSPGGWESDSESDEESPDSQNSLFSHFQRSPSSDDSISSTGSKFTFQTRSDSSPSNASLISTSSEGDDGDEGLDVSMEKMSVSSGEWREGGGETEDSWSAEDLPGEGEGEERREELGGRDSLSSHSSLDSLASKEADLYLHDNDIDRKIAQEAKYHQGLLQSSERRRGEILTVTRPIAEFSQIPRLVTEFCQTLMTAFSIWISAGYYLLQKSTGTVRLFYASSNTSIRVGGTSAFVRNYKDLRKYLKGLRDFDYETWIERPASDFVFLRPAYIQMNICQYTDKWLTGCEDVDFEQALPKAIRFSKHLDGVGLQNRLKTKGEGSCFQKACFWIAYLLHSQPRLTVRSIASKITQFKKSLAKEIRAWQRWKAKKHGVKARVPFEGITLHDIPMLERYLKLRINIFLYEEARMLDNGRGYKFQLSPLRLSGYTGPNINNTLNLLLINKCHLIRIKNLDRLTRVFLCPRCQQSFNQIGNLSIHMKHIKSKETCPGSCEKKLYKSGKAREPESTFDAIYKDLPEIFGGRDIGDWSQFRMDYVAVGDTESLHRAHPETVWLGPKQSADAYLDLFLITLATNVPGFQGRVHYFWRQSDDQQGLSHMIRSFLDTLHQISQKQKDIYMERFKDIFERLREKKELAELTNNAYQKNLCERCEVRLERTLSALPVLFYNSKHDLKSMQNYLIGMLMAEEPRPPKLLLRNGNYMLLGTTRLRFTDALSYIGVKIPYSKFLANLGIKDKKLKLWYEGFTCLADLETEGIPNVDSPAWRSKIHGGRNLLGDEDYPRFCELMSSGGLSFEEACRVLGRAEAPESPESEHARLSAFLRSQGVLTWRDAVALYSYYDTAPFLQAVLKLSDMFGKIIPRINLYRDFLSLPSLSAKMIHDHMRRNPGAGLWVPSRETHELCQKYIQGGISCVYAKEFLKGQTPVAGHLHPAGQAPLFQRGELWDVKSLYAHSMTDMECFGPGLVRKKDSHFIPEFDNETLKTNYYTELIAVWLGEKYKVEYRTQANGREFKVKSTGKRYKIDIVLFFKQGCVAVEVNGHSHFCHSCNTEKDLDIIHPLRGITYRQVLKYDKERLAALRKEFHKVVVVEVCWIKNILMQRQDFVSWMESHPTFAHRHSQRKHTVGEMVEWIKDGKIEGLVLARLEVPEERKAFFAAFPPLLARVRLSRQDLDPTSRDICQRYGTLLQPRDELIQTYKSEQLLETSYIRWLMEMGVVVRDISVILQYSRRTVLRGMVDRVMEERVKASAEFGNLWKLLLNAVYGQQLKNPSKDSEVLITENPEKLFQNKLFTKNVSTVGTNPLTGATIYMLVQQKRLIRYSNPIQVGVSILSRSKMQLMRGIIELMMANFRPGSFVVSFTDTDSANFAFPTESWEEQEDAYLIPERREAYFRLKDELLWDGTDASRKAEVGLFHLEHRWTEGVFMSSKSYILSTMDPKTRQRIIQKVAAKGWEKKQGRLTFEEYLHTNRNMTKLSKAHANFIYRDGDFHVAQCSKYALSSLCLKRKWLDNGIDSLPYDL